MKRFLSLLLALCVVLTIAGCGTDNTQSKGKNGATVVDTYKGKFRAGFGRGDITPDESVPLSGYGNSDKRFSEEIIDMLYIDAFAVSDQDNNTLMFMCIDTVAISEADAKAVAAVVNSSTGIPEKNVYCIATHTHSAPDMAENLVAKCGYLVEYKSKFFSGARKAAVDAMNDRAPAEIYIGETEATGISFVRHYISAAGYVSTDNHDTRKSADDPLVKHCSEVDPTLHFMKFKRQGKKDIIYTNWRAHGQMTGGSKVYSVSSDWVGPFRDKFEKESGAYVIYLQGAAGNINPKSNIAADNGKTDHREEGETLADYLLAALDNCKKVKSGKVKNTEKELELNINHTQDYLRSYAMLVSNKWNETANFTESVAAGGTSEIISPYQARAIIRNASLPKTQKFVFQVASIGDEIGFTFMPFEMFDTNGVWVEENSPYKYTMVQAYTNGLNGYLPSSFAFTYGSYECDITYCQPGTAEAVSTELVNMLKTIKSSK